MSSKDTLLILSDLALAVWSLLAIKQKPSCFFLARLQSHKFVILNSFHYFHTQQSATPQVRLDLLTYFKLQFLAPPSLASLKFNQMCPQMWTIYFCEDVP